MGLRFLGLLISFTIILTPSLSGASSSKSTRLTFPCSNALTSIEQLSPQTRVFLITVNSDFHNMERVSNYAQHLGAITGPIETSRNLISGILNSADFNELRQVPGVSRVGIGVTVLVSEQVSQETPSIKKKLLTDLAAAGFQTLNSDSQLFFGYVLDLNAVARIRSLSAVESASIIGNFQSIQETLP